MKIAKLTLKADLASTLFARLAPGVLSLLAVPLYVRVLGPEAYAIVGFLIAIQMIVGLLDSGLSTAVSREAAWLAPHRSEAGRLHNLLRVSERIFLALSLVILVVGVTAGPSLQEAMFNGDLTAVGAGPVTAVLIFAVIAARFPFAIHFGYLSGSGHIGQANIIVLVCDTFRTVGCVLVLLVVGPSLVAFLGWQLLMSIATTTVGARLSRQVTSARGPLDWSILRDIGRLAASSGMLSILFVLANSIDKIALPRFVRAAEFGSYIALAQIASIVFIVAQSLWSAINPRFIAAMSAQDARALGRLFSLQCALMVSAVVGAVLITGLAGDAVAAIWLGDAATSTSPYILVILTTGYASAALSHLALTQQQAGASMTTAVLALACALVFVPLASIVVLGAPTSVTGALTWSAIYAVFLLGSGLVFFGKARAFLRRWLTHVILPFVTTLALVAVAGRATQRLPDLAQLAVGCGTATLSAACLLMLNAPVREAAATLATRLARRSAPN